MQVIYLIGKNRLVHCTRIRIFEIIFSILDLLLSMIATPTDDLPVINDLQACQYAGEAVEVRSSIFAIPKGQKNLASSMTSIIRTHWTEGSE